MKVISKTGRDDIATVYVAEFADDAQIEFVESVEPPIPVNEKWVNIVSTLLGCPVECKFCDAGLQYRGKLSQHQIFSQIDYLVENRFRSRIVPVKKWKIQFARMGEPSFNHSVLDVLENLPYRYDAPGLLPSLSTIAPVGTNGFFERLIDIRRRLYPNSFQLQFSLHTTDIQRRSELMPVKCWDLSRISRYGEEFFNSSGRKITLNFALIDEAPVDPYIIGSYFDPDKFLVKFTPLNPTNSAVAYNIEPLPFRGNSCMKLVSAFESLGFEVILSLGELEENAIGSNCGQYISNIKKTAIVVDAYKYKSSPLEIEVN